MESVLCIPKLTFATALVLQMCPCGPILFFVVSRSTNCKAAAVGQFPHRLDMVLRSIILYIHSSAQHIELAAATAATVHPTSQAVSELS